MTMPLTASPTHDNTYNPALNRLVMTTVPTSNLSLAGENLRSMMSDLGSSPAQRPPKPTHERSSDGTMLKKIEKDDAVA